MRLCILIMGVALGLVIGVGSADAQFRRAAFHPTAMPFRPAVHPVAFPTFNTFTTFQTPRGVYAPRIPGVYNPATQAFSPSFSGSSVLASRGAFMPTNGTFVPSPVAYRGYGFNPISPYSPVNRARVATAAYYTTLVNAYANGINPYGYNPYSPAYYGAYPSGYGNIYGYGGAYGQPNYMPSAYVYGPGHSGASQASYQAPAPAPSAPQDTSLTALGVPNADGKAQWPLAFRLMPPNQKRDLLDKFEAQLQSIAAGGTSPVILNEARRSQEDLQHWLDARRLDLAAGTYRDANRLLQNLGKTLRTMSY